MTNFKKLIDIYEIARECADFRSHPIKIQVARARGQCNT